MMIGRSTALAASLVVISACSEQPPEPYIFDFSSLEAADAEIMRRALPAILKECPGLQKHRNRFAAYGVEKHVETPGLGGIDYPEASKPWQGFYGFDFVVVEGEAVPGRVGFRPGNHLFVHFWLDPIEVTSFKPIGEYVCGVKRIEDVGGYTARPAPHLVAVFADT